MPKAKKRKLIIRSSEWLRSNPDKDKLKDKIGDSCLFDGELFCCLGIDARACGFTRKQMAGNNPPDPRDLFAVFHGLDPDSLDVFGVWSDEEDEVRAKIDRNKETTRQNEYFNRWLDTRKVTNPKIRKITTRAMNINDDDKTNDAQKIKKLTTLFASVGIEIDWRPNE